MTRPPPRVYWQGLLTLFGLARRGYFIPSRYVGHFPDRAGRPAYRALEARFAAARPAMARVLDSMARFADDLSRIGADPPPAPRWEQSWFPRLDAAAAYVLVRTLTPSRIVEVGSGHSTRFMTRAIRDGGLQTRLVAIDPAPRASLDGLPIEILRVPLHAAGRAPFETLAPGDVLFIDSSHIAMPGSDVDLLLTEIVPGLPAGVLIHIHDVFLPDDYPAHMEWRGYNEQLAVAPLIHGGGFEMLFASRYVATRMADEVRASAVGTLPLPAGAVESSLWLRKGQPPVSPVNQ